MLIVPLEQRLLEHGQWAVDSWAHAEATARRLVEETTDPWLFHGTSMWAAAAILAEGFRCPSLHLNIVPEQNHVYWGPLDYAMNFSAKADMLDRPALLAARLSNILASGEPLPMTTWDRMFCEEDNEPELPDWQASIAESGCLRVRGGAHVKGLVLLGGACCLAHDLALAA